LQFIEKLGRNIGSQAKLEIF